MNKPRKRIITEISGVGDGELSSMLAMGQKHNKKEKPKQLEKSSLNSTLMICVFFCLYTILQEKGLKRQHMEGQQEKVTPAVRGPEILLSSRRGETPVTPLGEGLLSHFQF